MRIEPGIEAEIEAFWIRLTSTPRPVEAWLNRKGRLLTRKYAMADKTAELVGTYDRQAPLAAFRDDVFHVWESMHR